MSEQGKASWAEGTACTKIRRQEPARRMLAEGTKGMGKGWGQKGPKRGLDTKPEATGKVAPKRNPAHVC